MPDRHEHGGHDPATHRPASHAPGSIPSPVEHAPPADVDAAYRRAYDAAQPDPGRRVVAMDLEAREIEWRFEEGRTTHAWGYNGQVPGPTIEAEVGDVVEVRFTNRLPEPTTIHWHGLRVPAAMDGTDMVQRPIAPGEVFTWRFRVPDAGTFWYHPHTNETVQLERGLYGALIVRGPDEPRLDAERVLVLDDVQLDRRGRIKPPGGWVEWHNGREGSTRLVGGRQEPALAMAAGQIERWRIVNAASARFVRLSLGGRPFRILGTDGGLLEAPVTVGEVLLAPADRVDLAVGPFVEGEEIAVEALPHRRGKLGGVLRSLGRERFATLRVGPSAPSSASVPATLRRIEPLVAGAATPTREIRLSWKLSARHGVDFVINRQSHHRDRPVKVGELQVWDIVNGSPVDHPFHLHGFFFQVLEVNGEAPAFASWEDTVNVPARGRVRIAWRPDDRPGEWMYHCHILEHHAAGMMAHFEVVR